MKHLLLGILLILSQNSFGKTLNDRIYLENTDTADLQTDLAELGINIAYPMEEISGVCSLDIVANSYYRYHPIGKLLDQVEILTFFGRENLQPAIVSSTVIRVQLAPSFVDGIVVRTKKGNSLKEVIVETLGTSRKVVVMPRSCK